VTARARVLLPIAFAVLLWPAAPARAQSDDEIRIRRLEATPIGALPPLALPMPASRNHNYWGLRLQTGQRRGRESPDLSSIALGVDLQWRGGSVFGATVGYQDRDCDAPGDICGGHMMYGVRGRFNFITGGPSLGAMINDYSATTTIGTEIGIGYAPNVADGVRACTFDVGMPLSLALLQRVRLVPFLTPALLWDVDCSDRGPRTNVRFATSMGIGLQQLGLRGLDVYLGFQKIFQTDTGYHFGISVTWLRLP
jgi:hypothetical protein